MKIAIDGYSSCGKSTLAKSLAKELDFIYVDSGAMYRAVTLYFLHHDVALSDKKEVLYALEQIDIKFEVIDGTNTCFLNGVNVEDEIRAMRVSNNVSEVAAVPEVRYKLVDIQRKIGKSQSIVMDGRDIGTVVFPDAEIKFFIVADKKVRAKRRYDELISAGKDISMREVIANLEHRDFIDTSREVSPLRKAEDAIEIDNTHMTKEEQKEVAMGYISEYKDGDTSTNW